METMRAEPVAVASRRPEMTATSDLARTAHERLVENFDRFEATIAHLEDQLAAALRPDAPGRIAAERTRPEMSQVGHVLSNAADRVEDLHARISYIIDRIDLP